MNERKLLQRNQIETLIEVDYFSEFGNSQALLKFYDFFVNKLNQFKTQRIKIENFDSDEADIIKEYSTNISETTGKELSYYTLTNKKAMLFEFEKYFKEKYKNDFSYAQKIKFQSDNLGYIDLTTNKPQDRTTVYIVDLKAINNKFKGGVWKYRVDIKSLGTGNSATIYCPKALYERLPFEKGGVIKCTEKLFKDDKGYWNLTNYRVLSDGKEVL